MLAKLGPALREAAQLPADIGPAGGRHPGLHSWTPQQAMAEGVPPHHVPRSVSVLNPNPKLSSVKLLPARCQD